MEIFYPTFTPTPLFVAPIDQGEQIQKVDGISEPFTTLPPPILIIDPTIMNLITPTSTIFPSFLIPTTQGEQSSPMKIDSQSEGTKNIGPTEEQKAIEEALK